MRIAINGFGRIGRNFLRAICQDPAAQKLIEVVVINLGPKAEIKQAAHLFKYDTILGTYPGAVNVKNSRLIIDDKKIVLLAQTSPAACNWHPHSIDWVVDCSGRFTTRTCAQEHLDAGAQAVLISAPAEGDDVTIIPGVNDVDFDKTKHQIVSLGSCTTNALMPMLKVVHDAFTLQKAFMTTVHAYTNTQVLLDVECGDPRRSRAAALNIIPTSTGAGGSIEKVMPELKGKVQTSSLRVPVGIVSFLDLIFYGQQAELSKDSINAAFQTAADRSLQGILSLCAEPLVSSDFKGNSHSVIIDSLLTQADGMMGRVCGWYDNEWAYSMRLKEFLMRVAR